MRVAALLLLVCIVLGAFVDAGQRQIPAPRASGAARLPPVPEAQWTQRQREVVLGHVRNPPVTNDIRVLLNHPDLLPGVMPFWNYITSESTLPSRDRQILMLRTALRSHSAYAWAKYASLSASGGAGDTQRPAPSSGRPVSTIAAAADLSSLDRFDAALVAAADALHRTSFIDEATWNVLKERYRTEQLMDAVFTVGETSMLSMTLNSLRVPLDASFTARLPPLRPPAGPRGHAVLAAPRIPPLEPTFWTGELRVLLDPDATGRDIAAIYRTFARHPALYEPRQTMSEYIRLNATLPARAREIAILRIGALCGSDYEWAAHVRAGRASGLSNEEIGRLAAGNDAGWKPADAAVLHAVAELYRADDIGDATWRQLTAHYDRRQLLDLLVTVGGYRMVSMVLNTLGVPLERDSERIPRR